MDCQAHMGGGNLGMEGQVPGIVIVEIDPKSHDRQGPYDSTRQSKSTTTNIFLPINIKH